MEEDSHMEEVYAHDGYEEAEEWPLESPGEAHYEDYNDDQALARALAESMKESGA